MKRTPFMMCCSNVYLLWISQSIFSVHFMKFVPLSQRSESKPIKHASCLRKHLINFIDKADKIISAYEL